MKTKLTKFQLMLAAKAELIFRDYNLKIRAVCESLDSKF